MEERAEITLAELAAVIHGGRVAADGGEGGGLGLLFDILKYFELVELLNKSFKAHNFSFIYAPTFHGDK